MRKKNVIKELVKTIKVLVNLKHVQTSVGQFSHFCENCPISFFALACEN